MDLGSIRENSNFCRWGLGTDKKGDQSGVDCHSGSIRWGERPGEGELSDSGSRPHRLANLRPSSTERIVKDYLSFVMMSFAGNPHLYVI